MILSEKGRRKAEQKTATYDTGVQICKEYLMEMGGRVGIIRSDNENDILHLNLIFRVAIYKKTTTKMCVIYLRIDNY